MPWWGNEHCQFFFSCGIEMRLLRLPLIRKRSWNVTVIFMYISCIASLVWWYFIKLSRDSPRSLSTKSFASSHFTPPRDHFQALECPIRCRGRWRFCFGDVLTGHTSWQSNIKELSGGVARQDQGSKPEWKKSNIQSLPEVVDSIDC